jgi:hypothetical protein
MRLCILLIVLVMLTYAGVLNISAWAMFVPVALLIAFGNRN